MSTIQAKSYTPADLLKLPESAGIELVHGQLVEKPVSVLSARVEIKLASKLELFCDAHKTGVILGPTNGIQCFRDEPNKVRKPDISFVKRERFSKEHLREGFLSIAPDLAVEVISSRDEFVEITEKVEEYLAAGVPLVWIIDPENKLAYVHRRDGSVTKIQKNEELSGENIIPGFACKVAELFPEG